MLLSLLRRAGTLLGVYSPAPVPILRSVPQAARDELAALLTSREG